MGPTGNGLDRANDAIRPFTIKVPRGDLDDLHARLDRTRWLDEILGVGWCYGVPLGYLKNLAAYWRTTYDWQTHEAHLNAFPQFTTTIDGANVHFVHVRSPEPNALPLIVTHGWPGSIVEILKIIRPLADPRAHGGDPKDAFHVIAPSIPGHGLSGPTQDIGWDVKRVAQALAELMRRPGWSRRGPARCVPSVLALLRKPGQRIPVSLVVVDEPLPGSDRNPAPGAPRQRHRCQ
jgi:hypothetical protein